MNRTYRILPMLLALPLLAMACSKTKTPDTTVAPETVVVADTTVAAPTADSVAVSPDVTVTASSDTTLVGLAPVTATTAVGAPENGKRTVVTLVLDWTPNTNHSGFYLAKQNGFYKENGLEVNIIEPGADGGLAQLADRKSVV